MEDYTDIINKTLKELMTKYDCDHPLDALIKYAIEYEKEMTEEIKLEGKDVEKELKKLEHESNMFSLECAADPEKSLVYGKVIDMIENYDKYKGKKYII